MIHLLPKALQRYSAYIVRVGHMVEAVTLIAVIFASGYFTGQWVTYHVAQTERAQLRRDHTQELDRLNHSHTQALNILTGKIGRVVDKADTALDKADSAVDSAGKVVKEVRQASKKVDSVVDSAGKAVKEVRQANQAADKKVSTESINKSVEQANRLNK